MSIPWRLLTFLSPSSGSPLASFPLYHLHTVSWGHALFDFSSRSCIFKNWPHILTGILLLHEHVNFTVKVTWYSHVLIKSAERPSRMKQSQNNARYFHYISSIQQLCASPACALAPTPSFIPSFVLSSLSHERIREHFNRETLITSLPFCCLKYEPLLLILWLSLSFCR